MQKLIILLAFLSGSIMAKSMCMMDGIYTWPNTSTVKSNPVFVLDFYAASQKIVTGLNKQYPIYLRSGKQKVPLLIIETCHGQFRLTQVILKPARPLTPGLEYELVIDSLSKYDHVSKWNTGLRQFESSKWTVLKEADNDLPAWTVLPKYEKKHITHYGCGPATYVDFSFAAEDVSEILIKTTVTNTRTGKSATYYLQPDDNTKIAVGHGMCSGAFNFNTDDEYEVSFALMDASGNPGCLPSTPIRFYRPVDKGE